MNQQQAEKFVRSLMDMWENYQVNKLEQFYDPKVIGYYRDTSFGIEGIKNRMLYIKNRYPKQKHYVDEVVVVDANTVVARLRQTGIDKIYKQPYSVNLTGVYKFKKNLIIKVWIMPEGSYDYFAAPNELTVSAAKEKMTIDTVEIKRFNEKLKDFNYFYQGKAVKLTAREQECLYYFLNGYSAKEIGQLLKITFRTVQDHLAKVKAKYGCSSKHELRQKLFPTCS